MKNHIPIDKDRMLEALGRGEPEAFNLLFTHYFPIIKGFFTGFLASAEEAEDLAQDIFVKLWQYRSSLFYIDNLNAYLYRMSKNALCDYLRQNARTRYAFTSSLPEVPALDKLEELLFARELEEQINRIIDKMPPQRKTIFVLSRKEGMNNEAIAAQLRLSIRTVETHISAALSDIRKALYSRNQE